MKEILKRILDWLRSEREYADITRTLLETTQAHYDSARAIAELTRRLNQSQSFKEWLSRHGCTTQELWKIQNMLNACLPDHPLAAEAKEEWNRRNDPPPEPRAAD